MIKSLIMKIILFITLTFFETPFTSQVLAQTSNPNYDSQLAVCSFVAKREWMKTLAIAAFGLCAGVITLSQAY